jgi:hypothetical protein
MLHPIRTRFRASSLALAEMSLRVESHGRMRRCSPARFSPSGGLAESGRGGKSGDAAYQF